VIDPDSPVRPAEDEIRVLIADDHEVVREGMRAMLAVPWIRVVGDASTGREAAQQVAALTPHVVLMDVRMPDMDGLEATRLIKSTHPSTAIIVVTSFENQDYLRQAVGAGAAGYLLKGMTRELLLDAIRIVYEGGSMFAPEMLAGLLRDVARRSARSGETLGRLSESEMDTLRLVANGYTNREIADELGYSVGTIKNRVQALIEKLGVSDRTQAAVTAVRAGLEVD
jgi:DNA-binding NarL/FixJ family response regulator